MNLPGNTLYAAFHSTVERIPDAPAFTFLDHKLNERRYTYRELFVASEQIAQALREKELSPTAPLGLLLQSQESQVLHYLAACSLGLVPAILTPPNRKLQKSIYSETLKAVAEQCGFSAIIADPGSIDTEINATVIEAGSLRTVLSKPLREVASVEHAAFLQFSSGTTGIKRGVLVSHEAALHQLRAYGRAIDLQPHDCILSWLPLYHDMGFIACFNMPLALGVHTVMMQPLDWVANPAMFMQAASRYRATLSWNPNFAYAFMADRIQEEQLEGIDLSSLRGLINCSEPVTYESQNRFLTRFAPKGLKQDVFLGCYAMAETTFAVTQGRSGDRGYLDPTGPLDTGLSCKLPLVSVGRAIEGVEIMPVDDRGDALPDGRLGEIWVKSPFNFTGYYNNSAATTLAFDSAWYKTGDVGYRRGEELFICSRKKDLLILSGVNVFPQDVEEAVCAVDGVVPGRGVAFSCDDPRHQTERLIVLAEVSLPADQHADVIITIRQRVLATFQVANFEVHLMPPQWLMKSSSGKISAREIERNGLRVQTTSQGRGNGKDSRLTRWVDSGPHQ